MQCIGMRAICVRCVPMQGCQPFVHCKFIVQVQKLVSDPEWGFRAPCHPLRAAPRSVNDPSNVGFHCQTGITSLALGEE